MSYSYIIENQNPVIGPLKPNGKQEIGVHDYKSGNRRYIEADKDKVDTFISTRDKKIKKATWLGVLAAIGTAAACTFIGSKIPAKDAFSKQANTIMGMTIGAVGSLIPATLAGRLADKNITQKFIDENK